MWATSSASFFHSPLNLVTVIRTTRCVLISSHIEHEHRAPYISTLSPLNNRDFIALTVQWPFLHSPYRLKKLNYAADCCRRSLTNLYIRLKAARCHMIDMRAQQQQSISSRLNFTSTQKKNNFQATHSLQRSSELGKKETLHNIIHRMWFFRASFLQLCLFIGFFFSALLRSALTWRVCCLLM